MGFFSDIVKQVKKVVKSTAPVWQGAVPFVGPAVGFSSAGVVSGALGKVLPPSISKIASPIISQAAGKFFGGGSVSLGGGASPVSSPGAGLVAGRNKAAQTRRLSMPSIRGVQTGINFGTALAELSARRARTAPPTLAPVSRESLGYPTRDIIASPGGSRLPPGVTARPAMSTFPAIARAVPGIVRTVTGKISRIVTPEGRSFSRKQVVSFAKRFGPEAAAAALGVTVADVLSSILDDSTTRRRRRGITPKDLQTTRRTICKVKSMHKMISGTPVRRRTCK